MIPERQVKRIGSPVRSPSPVRNANRSPAPFSSRKITSITVNSLSRPGTPSERADSRIEVITPDVYYYEPPARYTPDLPSRPLVQAPTNYTDFVRTTPPAGQPGPMPNADVKVTKIFRKTPNSPGPERKISTGSQTGTRRRRVPPKDSQKIMVASIANFDEPRRYASVKPPRISSGIQTDDAGSDFESTGAISISIQADLNPAASRVTHKFSDSGKVQCDVTETARGRTPDSFSATPPLEECDRFAVPPPPPTPLLSRRNVSENNADRIIRENENLLELFPPLPKAVIEEKYTKVGDELANQKPPSPKVPKKPKIDPKVSIQMKLRAQQNSTEVHRLMSPMLNRKAETPIFSDAGESNISWDNSL